MKLDAHVHTHYSGMTTIWPVSYIVRESYNTPERIYRLAKSRGMDLVAITDHDTIEGALTLAHLPDVVVGLPLLCLPLMGAVLHFLEEDRFNRSLLFDLVAHPALAHRSQPVVTEAA